MPRMIDLTHTCKDKTVTGECSVCTLIDLTIGVLHLFNSRPDYFNDTLGQQLIARALLINMSIQESMGVIRTVN